jgi:hypothetical protein
MPRAPFVPVLIGLIAALPAQAADNPPEKSKGGSAAERAVDKAGKAIGKTADRATKSVGRGLKKAEKAVNNAGEKTGKWIKDKTN